MNEGPPDEGMPPRGPELLLASRRCSECLTTRNRIVTGRRAADIVRACRRERNHFVCHKGQNEGLVVHCRGVHDAAGGSRAHDFAQAFDIPVREIDPDDIRAGAGRGTATIPDPEPDTTER